MKTLVWFRRDLRTHDHEGLALAAQGESAAIYVFEDREFGVSLFGFERTGGFRARFLQESVEDLRERLEIPLLVRKGRAEEIVPEVARALGVNQVVWHDEPGTEERDVARLVQQRLYDFGIEVRRFDRETLVLPEDLPFDVSLTPAVFTRYRQEIERRSEIRREASVPGRMEGMELGSVARGEIPSLVDLGVKAEQVDERGMSFQGGESAGLERLDEYLWAGDHLRRYKETRNGMLGEDYSSKFSPWLALGCLSPRRIYREVRKYEKDRVKNESTYWLVFELFWRDYFHYVARQQGEKLFYRGGLQRLRLPWSRDRRMFEAWAEGRTGYDLVDACMVELRETGFLSNRGRQVAASFLTKGLNIDWRMGAEWFESLLVDFDVASNYGNWQYQAGVGNDVREFRVFDPAKQAALYDPDGVYVQTWLGDREPVEPVIDFDQEVERNRRVYLVAAKPPEWIDREVRRPVTGVKPKVMNRRGIRRGSGKGKGKRR